jgi:hypothetical protein
MSDIRLVAKGLCNLQLLPRQLAVALVEDLPATKLSRDTNSQTSDSRSIRDSPVEEHGLVTGSRHLG